VQCFSEIDKFILRIGNNIIRKRRLQFNKTMNTVKLLSWLLQRNPKISSLQIIIFLNFQKSLEDNSIESGNTSGTILGIEKAKNLIIITKSKSLHNSDITRPFEV
jgi:hypothetical protein